MIYNQSHSGIVKAMNELVGTSIHHDTITGTSPTFVIANETLTLETKGKETSKILSNSLKLIVQEEEGLYADGLE